MTASLDQKRAAILLLLVYSLSNGVSSLALPNSGAGGKQAAAPADRKWPAGDARWCLQESSDDLQRFEVLPGVGWDNLLNVETSPVVTFDYSSCQLTDDGRFLLPDNIYTIPVKMSKLETFAELIDSLHQSTSVTSRTINANPGFSMPGISISGKFSHEHQLVKSKQIEDSSVTVRVQLRYNRYEAKLRPFVQLSPEFRESLLNIGAYLSVNRTSHARHESELLVRNFGTHVLTSVTAGAALVKDDFVKRKFIEQNSDEKSSYLASASGVFKRSFSLSLDADGSVKSDKSEASNYTKSLTHSYTETHGGDLFLPGGMKAKDWAKNVDDNLVAMDRAGDPIYMYINPHTLPGHPASAIERVQQMVKEAVELYYEMNVIPGCTDISSPKFSFSANFDDGSCQSEEVDTALTLGGIYQTCEPGGRYIAKNPCTGMVQNNALTGGLSCPDGFQAVLLHEGVKETGPEFKRRCRICRLFTKCCTTDAYIGLASYKTYWCAGRSQDLKAPPADESTINAKVNASQPVTGPKTKRKGSQKASDSDVSAKPKSQKQTSDRLGYIFGGVYTGTTDNLVTGEKNCPPGFYHRHIFVNLQVCISDDFEKDSVFGVSFGGFFSCSTGNPLAVSSQNTNGRLTKFMQSNSTNWPYRCPQGYSQHLATVANGCAVHFCVESGALQGPNLPKVKRPPFSEIPAAVPQENQEIGFDERSNTWVIISEGVKPDSIVADGILTDDTVTDDTVTDDTVTDDIGTDDTKTDDTKTDDTVADASLLLSSEKDSAGKSQKYVSVEVFAGVMAAVVCALVVIVVVVVLRVRRHPQQNVNNEQRGSSASSPSFKFNHGATIEDAN